MSLEDAKVAGRNFRNLRFVSAFKVSTFLEYSRGSPGALILSEAFAAFKTSEDEFLNRGAELEGDVSPDALATPA